MSSKPHRIPMQDAEHFSGSERSSYCICGKFKAWSWVLGPPPHICSCLSQWRRGDTAAYLALLVSTSHSASWSRKVLVDLVQPKLNPMGTLQGFWLMLAGNRIERKLRHKKDKYWKSWYGKEWCWNLLGPRQGQIHQTALHGVHIPLPKSFIFV